MTSHWKDDEKKTIRILGKISQLLTHLLITNQNLLNRTGFNEILLENIIDDWIQLNSDIFNQQRSTERQTVL